MKNTLFFLILFAAILVTGCAKENSTARSRQAVPVSVGGTVAGSRAVINPGDPFTARVIASANADNFAVPYVSGDTPAPFDLTVNFSATGEGTISPVQYYPINGGPIYIRGFAPVAPRTGSTVSYLIDGTQDIMVSEIAQGTDDNVAPLPLTFNHLLTQLVFSVVAVDANAVATWGNILGIDILEQNTALDLDLNTGILVPNAAPQNSTLTVPGSAVALTTTQADAGVIMIYPRNVASAPLRVSIRTENNGVHVQTIRTMVGGNILAPGTAYNIILSFNRTQITISATVTPWASVTWTSSMGE